MEYRDYYQILGVDKSADEDAIHKAYRRLARKYHPDVNPGDDQAEAKFKEINEAHEVLSDAEKRRKYDELGSSYQQWQRMGRDPRGFDWSQWTAGGQPGGGRIHVEYGDLGDLFGGGGFSDFFRNIFGGAAGGRTAPRGWGSTRGQDIEHPVDVTLEEAYTGTKRILQMGNQRIEVTIPAGVDNGSRVRIAGQGGAGGGKKGDLYLRISVLPHTSYRRQGDNLVRSLSVDVYTAVLGGEIKVPTIKGSEVMLTIPSETQNGKRFRLKGLGMPKLKDPNSKGDMYVDVHIKLPQHLSDEEQELFQELKALRTK
jgi:curved DNA-binding protein